jgi:hypothetical protein
MGTPNAMVGTQGNLIQNVPGSLRHVSTKTAANVSSSANGMAMGGARQMQNGVSGAGSAADMKRNNSNNFSNNSNVN